MNDYQLDQIAEDMAREILAEIAEHGEKPAIWRMKPSMVASM